MNAELFIASQIGRALGLKRQAVRRLLVGIPPCGKVIIAGNAANGWTLAALPANVRRALAASAAKSGCDVRALLSGSAEPWTPAIALDQVAQHCLDKAAKLQRALRRVLAMREDLAVSPAALERAGLDDFGREFGHPITGRYLRALIDRTIERAGAGTLDRLDLYLDEAPARKSEPKPVAPIQIVSEFRELPETIATFKNPAAPTDGECAYLWLRAFELYEEKITGGAGAKATRLNLLKALRRCAPFLAKSSNALRVTFTRKYELWVARDRDPASLSDGRRESSGFHRAPELASDDRDALIAHAVLNCDGRVSQAWRELAQRRALSEGLLGYYLNNPASKSYCPSRIREAVKHEVAMMDDIHHGPRQDKLNGAHLSRDWSGVASMDWLCADDATLEVYFYVPDGNGWFTLMRGQFLVFIDVRSLRSLGFGLQPEKNYNARVIRTLITRVCDEHGLPRRGFYFEMGVWKNSRILKGDPQADPFSWGETELGLRSLGLRFVHSRLPRSKPVERVIGALQDLCEGEPGYVGPDEKREKFERVQRAKLQVDARKIHPAEHFYSLDEWVSRLEEICDRYNATAQDGKMTGGLSPDEAFQRFSRSDDPPTKLPPDCRYLLAHHRRPIKVSSNGITLRFGNQSFNYRSEQTGRLRGQTVLAWFNPELPEILTVTDTNRENAFCVERSQDVPAMDAPAELLEQENARIAEHLSYARVRYRMLRSKFATPFRRVVVDAATAELGAKIQGDEFRLVTERVQRERTQAKARKLSRNLRMALPPTAAARPETLSALERLNSFLNEEETK